MSETTSPDPQAAPSTFPALRDIIGISFFAIFFGFVLFACVRSEAQLRGNGRLKAGILAPRAFEFSVWHQNSGNLHNGKLQVWIKGKGLNPREKHFEFSFETWPPNSENARTYSVEILKYDPSDPIEVTYSAEGIWIRSTVRTATWVNGGWKE